jgi:hypothetical protein
MFFVFVHPDCNKYEPVLVYASSDFEEVKTYVLSLCDEKDEKSDIQCEEQIPISLATAQKYYDCHVATCPGEHPYIYIIEIRGPDNAFKALQEMKELIV